MLSVVLVLFAYKTSTEHVDSVAQTLSTATFLQRVDELFSAIQDAETGQRGYLLTGRRAYLVPFLNAQQELPGRFREIDKLAAQNGVPQSQLNQLHALVEEKLQELEKTVRLEAQTGHQAALAEVETDRGHRLMEQIRTIVRSMKESQQRTFQDRVRTQQRRQRLLDTVLICAIGVTLLFLFLASQLSSRFADEQAAVEREIRRLNVGLENRVQARTAELEASAAELKRRSSELEKSNADLTQFAYVASHDLQEPLRMVGSYMGLLEKRYGPVLDERAKMYIQFALQGAARMQTLINDLLQYSRAGTQPLQKRTVSSAEVVQTALKNLELAIRESSADIHYGWLPAVHADPTKLTQVFQNLIGNSIKFHKPGQKPEIDIRAERANNEWIFSISDNGIGFDTAYQDRIYEIFQRLHGAGEYTGNGIGLAICRRIVEHHGGRLWAESAVGAGAVFHFSLPADVTVPPSAKVADSSA